MRVRLNICRTRGGGDTFLSSFSLKLSQREDSFVHELSPNQRHEEGERE